MVALPSFSRADAPFEQAEALWAEGDLERAIWEYRKAVASASLGEEERAFGLFRLGMAQMGAGQESQALETFRQVEQRHSEHPLAPFALIFQANYALLERSQLGGGIRMYEDLIRRYPKSEAALQAAEWLPGLRKMSQSKLRAHNLKRKRKEAEAERRTQKQEKQTE